jgi:hypothetical protein
MAELFLELIANFKAMAEYSKDNISIGGVEASAAGSLEFNYIIEYKTPFQ